MFNVKYMKKKSLFSRFIGMKLRSVTFVDTTFRSCYFDDVTSVGSIFRNCTIIGSQFFNTGEPRAGVRVP